MSQQDAAETVMIVPLLVIGCGNELAGDDGVGAELVRRLMRRKRAGCAFRIVSRAPADVLELFDSAGSILFIDAVVSGAEAGTIHLTPLPSPRIWGKSLTAISTHGFGVVEAIGLARALRRSIPEMSLIGIEADQMERGGGLSPAVTAAIEYCETHFDELREIARSGESRTIVPDIAVV